MHVDLCSDLLDMSPEPQVTKNKRVPIHQTGKLLQSKRNDQQNEKLTYKMGEDSYKQLASQGDRLGQWGTRFCVVVGLSPWHSGWYWKW